MHTSHSTPIVQSLDEYTPGQTFEQLVVSRFEPYLGCSIRELCTKFSLIGKVDKPGIYRMLTNAILGIPLNSKIEEFEKGDVPIRVIYIAHPKHPQSRKRYFLWHVGNTQTGPYLHKVEFWTLAVNDQHFIDRL